MPQRSILSVGFELAADECPFEPIRSNISLLDYDIVLFRPDIHQFVSLFETTFQGKPCLSDDGSFHFKETCEHWRREIHQAFENGKTVIVFMSDLREVYIDTGERTHSGTGRNRKTTRHVAASNNYQTLPVKTEAVPAKGAAMKLAARGADLIAAYWKEFGAESQYKVLLEGGDVPARIYTKSGNKAVGAIYSSKSGPGKLILLPDLDFERDEFFDESEEDEVYWTEEATQFADRLLAAVVGIDKAAKSSGAYTPEPDWAKSKDYVLPAEPKLREDLLAAEQKLEAAQKAKEQLQEQLASAGQLRRLLFEKGPTLESAIVHALGILGFQAEPFRDAESEFDVVFSSSEGRLIGEAEGKDSKAINVEKLRQLSMNINEDLEREDVTEPAKPVLFGNAYRLAPPEDREDPFTTKCAKASEKSNTALVFTPDLFRVAQYLESTKDEAFATSCREAVLYGAGRVEFPAGTTHESQDAEMLSEDNT